MAKNKISFLQVFREYAGSYKEIGKLKEYSKTQLTYMAGELNRQINRDIQKYRAMDGNNASINQAIRNLQAITGKGRQGEWSIGTGSGKTKQGLIRQIREMEYFNNIDINSDFGKTALEEKYKKSFKEFSKHIEGVTQEQYREITEAFGALGSELVEKFESDTVAAAYVESGKTFDLYGLMKKVYDENNSLDQQKLTEILRKEIKSL